MNRFAALGLLAEALDGKRIAVVVQESVEVIDTLDAVLQAATTFVGSDAGVADLDLRVIRRNGGEEIRTPNGGRLMFMTSRGAGRRVRGFDLAAVYLERYAYIDPASLNGLTRRGTEVVEA